MKKKLTLTVQEDVINYAKRKAKRQGISVSQMFEEVMGKGETNEIVTEHQRAAKKLLETLKQADNTATKDDKKLIREHVKRKFA